MSVRFFCLCFFFFKQKTAYELRISDWSSDVCSSDLAPRGRRLAHDQPGLGRAIVPGWNDQPGAERDRSPWERLQPRAFAPDVALRGFRDARQKPSPHPALRASLSRRRERGLNSGPLAQAGEGLEQRDRKSTRLNSSH